MVYNPSKYVSKQLARPTFEQPTVDEMEWRDEAECAGEDTELFFVQTDERGLMLETVAERKWRVNVAKGICAECKVKTQCLEDAITTDEMYGVRGGMTPDERWELTKKVVPAIKTRLR